MNGNTFRQNAPFLLCYNEKTPSLHPDGGEKEKRRKAL
jgi:hypothetical protein